ncbi:MAG: NAD(+)/NADH kinase [Clostridia bacterium]|nr:NAD(+)/NADH kinase [Clostridia bacterium]
MKVLLYINEKKDEKLLCAQSLEKILSNRKIEYDIISENDIPKKCSYDVLFVVGGDGTILRRTEFANSNNLPIIGINAGKLGFLTEFEHFELEQAVDMFIKGELKKDYRLTLEISYKNKKYFALNDVVVQRTYTDRNGMIINTIFSIDDNVIDKITGDGVIVATPTGSTAYSLSVGGAILTPGINAFSFVPIAAHSLEQRPIIFSAESTSCIEYDGGCSAGLFVDGKMIDNLSVGDKIYVRKTNNPTIFLRRENFVYYTKLSEKLKSRSGK